MKTEIKVSREFRGKKEKIMDIKVAFHILEIEQTKDEAPIREAYRRLIQVTNPEDDQEGFKRLREAYDTAMEYTRATEEEQEKAEP